jgi:5-methylcytosine-specific restriction endonuclease McrA
MTTRYPTFRHGCTAPSFAAPNGESEAERIRNSSRWKRTSRLYRSVHPVCELCRSRLSEHVHHRVSLARDPKQAFHWRNLQALCLQCHEAEHAGEPGRGGKQRGKGDPPNIPKYLRKKTQGLPSSESSIDPATFTL